MSPGQNGVAGLYFANQVVPQTKKNAPGICSPPGPITWETSKGFALEKSVKIVKRKFSMQGSFSRLGCCKQRLKDLIDQSSSSSHVPLTQRVDISKVSFLSGPRT